MEYETCEKLHRFHILLTIPAVLSLYHLSSIAFALLFAIITYMDICYGYILKRIKTVTSKA